MHAAGSRRDLDILLFWSLDRLSREGAFETMTYPQKLTSYGVGYRSYKESYLDSCGMFRDGAIGILATIMKQKRVKLSERAHADLRDRVTPQEILMEALEAHLKRAGV